MSNLKNTRVLTDAALLVAIGIILGFLKIPVTSLIEIRLESLPTCIAGFIFGPAVAAVVGALTDIGSYLVKPTGPFFPGFTISYILTGIIFGVFLHGKEPAVKRILLAVTVNTLLVNTLLNGFWLSFLYGMPFGAVIAARIVKQLIMIPINTLIITAALKSVRRLPIAQGQGY